MRMKKILIEKIEKTIGKIKAGGYKNYIRYYLNELKWKLKGDDRDLFMKKVHRCRYLDLPDIIYNMSSDGEC